MREAVRLFFSSGHWCVGAWLTAPLENRGKAQTVLLPSSLQECSVLTRPPEPSRAAGPVAI